MCTELWMALQGRDFAPGLPLHIEEGKQDGKGDSINNACRCVDVAVKRQAACITALVSA